MSIFHDDTCRNQCAACHAGAGPVMAGSLQSMCGRFTRRFSWREVHTFLRLGTPTPALNLRPRYNLAPSRNAAVVRDENGERRLSMLRWGLIPGWAKDPSIGHKLIDARAETAAVKPSFRAAYSKRRCLVPTVCAKVEQPRPSPSPFDPRWPTRTPGAPRGRGPGPGGRHGGQMARRVFPHWLTTTPSISSPPPAGRVAGTSRFREPTMGTMVMPCFAVSRSRSPRQFSLRPHVPSQGPVAP